MGAAVIGTDALAFGQNEAASASTSWVLIWAGCAGQVCYITLAINRVTGVVWRASVHVDETAQRRATYACAKQGATVAKTRAGGSRQTDPRAHARAHTQDAHLREREGEALPGPKQQDWHTRDAIDDNVKDETIH